MQFLASTSNTLIISTALSDRNFLFVNIKASRVCAEVQCYDSYKYI